MSRANLLINPFADNSGEDHVDFRGLAFSDGCHNYTTNFSPQFNGDKNPGGSGIGIRIVRKKVFKTKQGG